MRWNPPLRHFWTASSPFFATSYLIFFFRMKVDKMVWLIGLSAPYDVSNIQLALATRNGPSTTRTLIGGTIVPSPSLLFFTGTAGGGGGGVAGCGFLPRRRATADDVTAPSASGETGGVAEWPEPGVVAAGLRLESRGRAAGSGAAGATGDPSGAATSSADAEIATALPVLESGLGFFGRTARTAPVGAGASDPSASSTIADARRVA
jgi:hypothetical protein